MGIDPFVGGDLGSLIDDDFVVSIHGASEN
jgi:hypothetical protein